MALREVPDEIRKRCNGWRKWSRWWWFAHYFFGFVGLGFAIISIVMFTIGQNFFPWHPVTPGAVSTFCIAIVAFLRPSYASRGFNTAWTKLSSACDRYTYDDGFTRNDLQNVLDEGEQIIRESGIL